MLLKIRYFSPHSEIADTVPYMNVNLTSMHVGWYMTIPSYMDALLVIEILTL